jgi:arylsulfatase A-like enzyme
MNVLWIVSDTLRRDYLGCYGNKWVRTPNLDRFASESLVFEQCYSGSFPTMPARADMFTGKLVFASIGWGPMPEGEKLVAQLLSGAGYATMAITDVPFYLRQCYGYDRGFQDFMKVRGQHDSRAAHLLERSHEEDYCAPRTMREAEKWLEHHYRDRFFLFADTWDPHEPWDPPRYYVEQYLPDYDGRVVGPPYARWRPTLSKRDFESARACYAGEITMVDRAVGRLLERVESLGLRDKTAIIFTTDHGFYIGEHGWLGKGVREKGGWVWSPLYEELIHIPLLIRVPGVKPGRIDTMVTLADLMPTALELAGQQIPPGLYGKSLLRLWRGSRRKLRDVILSAWPLYDTGDVTRVVDGQPRRVRKMWPITVHDGEWTLIYSMAGEKVELFHTKLDPQQRKNLFRQNRPIAEALRRRFVEIAESVGASEALMANRRSL